MKSGWRDLNPRPVAAATVLLTHTIQFVPTPPGFKISLLSDGFNTTWETFSVDERPRTPMARSLGYARIVLLDSGSDVLTRSDVAAPGFGASQNINVKH